MSVCHLCEIQPTFKKCHVVSDFVIRYLKTQSIQGAIYYSWAEKFAQKQIYGPYFCRDCDNHVIGTWETRFSQDVFPDPMAATNEWGLDSSIKFILSLCYRYAMHNLRVSPHRINTTLNELFRDVGRAALRDTSRLGTQLFVYPYVYRPLTMTCGLRPGVNRFLTMGFHSRPHPAEENLPNVLAVYLPRMIFLYSLGDLTQTGDPDFAGFTDLRPGATFTPATSNIEMPEIFAQYINQGILETKRHLSGWGLWNRFNRRAMSGSNIHQCLAADEQLRGWQRVNCVQQQFA